MLLTVVAFLAALGLLIAVHEYGHYRVAVACGVKVLRFSVGFGRPLLRWQRPGSPTEFVVGAFPLGGYVRMLDEREAPVAEGERHLAFNTQPLRARAAIVVAGPLANLLLAVLLFTAVNWIGVPEPRALLPVPSAGSLAERAGVHGGELVQAAAQGDEAFEPLRSFDDLRWRMTRAALDGQPLRLQLQSAPGRAAHEVVLALDTVAVDEADPRWLERIGLPAPWSAPVLGAVSADGAGARAGLKEGDRVLRVDVAEVRDAAQLRALIRASVVAGQAHTQHWSVLREGQARVLEVTPAVQSQDGVLVGRIGAYVGAAPEMLTVRYGAVEGLVRGAERTWEVSVLSLRMLGRMVVGEASVKNLSGPLTIADYAGRSAALGLVQYLAFLALISVSLGVLNLLPLPVLDGGHLMYYLWEWVTGRAVSDAWMQRLQQGGTALLLLMMSVAVFNDFTRLFG